MPSRSSTPLRSVAAATAFAWILAQGQGLATAVHVAEDHAHHGHHHAHHHDHDHAPDAAPAAGTVALTHDHAHAPGHVHGLPESLPGIRNDARAGLVTPAAVPGAGFALAADHGTTRVPAPSRRPDPPPTRAPAVLLL